MTKPKYRFTNLHKTNSLIVFVLLFLFANKVTFSQTLTLSGGCSIPFGMYATKDFTQKDAGIANKGYALHVMFEDNRSMRVINPYFQYTYNNNPFDQDAVQKYIKVISPNVIGVQGYKPWVQNILMLGAKANYYHNNFNIYGKMGLGLAWANTFGYNYYDTTSGFDVIKRKIANDNTLALSIGLGTSIRLYENVNLTLAYDLFYAKTNYGKPAYVDAGGNPIGTSENYQAPLQTTTFSIGLSFYLTQKNQ
jgi:opacity protein-like surface antigen